MKESAESSTTMEYSLLGFLSERRMHGYELSRCLRQKSGVGIVWHVKQSRLYALLSRLSDRGLVTVTVEMQPSRPTRKVFSLTPKGRDTFVAWLRTPVPRGRSVRMDFIAKLYFAHRIDPHAARELVSAQRIACRAWHAENEEEMSARKKGDFDRLVYDFRARQTGSMLEWLDACEEFLVEKGSE